ncbi:hypothetical protein SAMN04487905_102143 [Actinopolyspora xinjiangensis]|uniref:non-specific serine/threonine protein kinase n=1 Tax=Actinopolyspora xinjiangensis TaxID=405564 RepID=A0A1H0Q9H5_9ACTN|nr:serine/threonine-protein kinase [Actinopolyspora xinjiangensis]SDP14043.1 hypothetical protein SAMN04487905_102143 [Actinopolyspora xinjiangensis]
MSDEGRLVAGRYRVQRRIGSGAMGVVWECVDERLHRTVAVKQLLTQPGLDPAEAEEARQRAMREGRIAARLQHPHAVSVYDVAEENGEPVLVMEYLPSTSLASMMSEHGPLPPREVARIGAQVAAALGAAHSAGVVHRDIKPGNVLLGDEGTVKITDFGISRAQGDVAVTKTGMLAGTPAYLSPDVACGKEPSPASDVFSLGATLYAAIEGRPPFGQNENTLALLHSVAAGKVEPPRNAGPMTEPLLAMLRPDAEERPDMAQVHEMLQAVAEGQAVSSVPTKAAPIPPAMHPGTAAATDPPSNPRDGGTAVAGTRPEEDERYGGTGRAEAASYPDSAPRAEPTGGKPRGRTPLVVSGVLLVVAAVAGILVATSLLSDDAQRENPAGGGETSRPLVPPASETNITENTVPDYPEDDGYQDPAPDWNRTTTETTEPPIITSAPESSAERSSAPATESSAPEDDQGDGTESGGGNEEGSGDDGSGGSESGDGESGNDGTAGGDPNGEDGGANGGQGSSSGDGS